MDAPSILALATLVTSVATAFATVFALLKGQDLGRSLKAQDAKLQENTDTMLSIEKKTDGLTTALVKVTGEAEHAKGKIEGKAQEKERAADASDRAATQNAIADKPEGS